MDQHEQSALVFEIEDQNQIICPQCNYTLTLEEIQSHPCLNGHSGPEEECFEDKLIELVQNRPLLWDGRIPITGRSIVVREDLWKEIMKNFNEKYTIDVLKKKWKYPRDQYIKTKDDVEEYTPSGPGQKTKKKIWKHYEKLTLISDSVKPRKTFSNIKFAESVLNENQPTDDSSEENRSKKKKQGNNGYKNDIIDAIKTLPPPTFPLLPKINPICQRISDIIEELPPRKRAKVEMQLLNITYRFYFEDDL